MLLFCNNIQIIFLYYRNIFIQYLYLYFIIIFIKTTIFVSKQLQLVLKS